MSASDIHELCLSDPNDINRHSGWDIDFRQIEPGPMATRVALRQGKHVTLLEIQMDRAVHQLGRSPAGEVTFGLPLTPALQSWHGANIETPGLLSFWTATAFEGMSRSDFAGLTVSISEPFLACVADRIGLPVLDDIRRETLLPFRRESAGLSRIAAIGRALLYGCQHRFDDREQQDFVAGLLCAAADAEKFDDRSTSSTRARAVRIALDYMNDHAGDGISVGEICAATGVSWRTLDRGFGEQFGIGPKAYLSRYRLGRARSGLLRMSSDARVADVANDWGFWHMGQFARDYRRMFGELPSTTLQANGS